MVREFGNGVGVGDEKRGWGLREMGRSGDVGPTCGTEAHIIKRLTIRPSDH